MTCEDFLMQKFALADGEKTDFLPADEIEAHFAACENCRREFVRFEALDSMFRRQTRNAPQIDLWTAIEKRVGADAHRALPIGWQPFAVLGVMLAAYKLLEMVPERDFGWAIKLVPFVLVAALFGFLKENPFKINTGLSLEK